MRKQLKEQLSALRLCHTVSNEEIRTTHEQSYMRKVLKKTPGCVLFDPNNHLKLLTDQQMRFTNDKLILNLTSIVRSQSRLKNFTQSSVAKSKLNDLNVEYLKQYVSWPVEKQLFALDAWHFVRAAHVFKYEFFRAMIEHFLNEFNRLPHGPALQIMYYVAWTKRRFSETERKNVIDRFEKIVEKLELDALSIYCLALIKSGAEIRNVNLVSSMYRNLLQNDFRKFDDIAITGILKAIRRFSTPDHINRMTELQKKLVDYAKVSSLFSLTHIAHLGYKQRVCHHELLEVIVRRFLQNLNKLRIKDVERACLSIATFGLTTPDQLDKKFSHEVQRLLLQLQYTNHPVSMIRCISYLAVQGSIDPKLIEWALDPRTLFDAYGESLDLYEHPVLVIDSIAKINLAKTYKGPCLSDSVCEQLVQQRTEKFPDGENMQILNQLMSILNANKVKAVAWKSIPHSHIPDIYLVYDVKKHKTVDILRPVPGKILNANDFVKDTPHLVAVALVLCSQFQVLSNARRFSGYFQMKLDQLKLLGFKTIIIKHADWKRFASAEAQKRYLTSEFRMNNIFPFQS